MSEVLNTKTGEAKKSDGKLICEAICLKTIAFCGDMRKINPTSSSFEWRKLVRELGCAESRSPRSVQPISIMIFKYSSFF